jgi:hypothetical protein
MEGERGRGKETKGEGREGERSAGDRTHFNPTLISFSLSPPPPPPGGHPLAPPALLLRDEASGRPRMRELARSLTSSFRSPYP